MKEIDLEELKIIQMDILSAVHRFCISNNLKYSLGCGSMLGCARHKGYIPWDDDIDIYMLREDYDRLMREFPETLEGCYKFAAYKRTPNWIDAYGKIYDSRTILKEGGINREIGVNIDVFPVDNVPQEGEEWRRYNAHRCLWRNLYYWRVGNMGMWKRHEDRSFFKDVMMSVFKVLLQCVPTRILLIYFNRIATKYKNKETGYVFECVQGVFCKNPFPKTLFNNLALMPFEDREYMAFSDYDKYLTLHFGDWRELPPVEKRVTHHKFKAWWK